jgi:hypothetical protein
MTQPTMLAAPLRLVAAVPFVRWRSAATGMARVGMREFKQANRAASTAAACRLSYLHLKSLISICRHFALTVRDRTESGGVARELSGMGFPSDVQDIWAKVASRLSYLGLPHTDSIPGASTSQPLATVRESPPV